MKVFNGRRAFMEFLRVKRKGNLLVITMFAVMIAIVSFATLQVMTSVYSSAKENAKQYANIQSYRAMTEVACYTYVTDLCAQIETIDLGAGFIAPNAPAMYTESVKAIQDAVGQKPNPLDATVAYDPLIWGRSTILSAITGAPFSDAEVVVDLISLCSKGINEFELKLVEYPEIDWGASDNNIGSKGGVLALAPLEVNVNLRIRGERVKETYIVQGLKLSVDKQGGSSGILTVQIVEPDEGVKIYRD